MKPARLNEVMKQCQAAYDHAEPEDPEETCEHVWVFVGADPDGTAFYRCGKCRTESED